MPRDLDGRVVLVTGATDGLGRAAAGAFAARGATLTIVGRDEAKTRLTAEDLRRTAGNPAVDTLCADLSSLAGMRAVTAGFLARRQRLDILVNNAGAVFQQPSVTVDGLEKTFALNHLAYFVVTTGLLGLLRQTPGARVVNTASSAHHLGRRDVERMPTRAAGPGFAGGFRAYCDSKLANVVFTRELARRLAPSGVTANCHHPGYTRSGFFAGTSGPIAYATGSRAATLVARTPERAADTLVWLATDDAAAPHTGGYFLDRTARPVSRAARDDRLGARLWTLSERLAA